MPIEPLTDGYTSEWLPAANAHLLWQLPRSGERPIADNNRTGKDIFLKVIPICPLLSYLWQQ
jgi:hypothetical protein